MIKPAFFARFPYFLVNFVRKPAVAVVLLAALAACSSSGVTASPEYSDKQREDRYKNGSLASESGGFSLLGSGEKKAENTGIGVNGYLWRASLDTISFMPVASADPFGGLITTDWYSASDAPNERAKVNIFILDRELRADGVKVTVFRQTRDSGGDWEDAAVAPSTATQLEETILTRARQLKLAQREGK
jgi:hypothetical protein